ncbi:hypothetical protein A5886_001023 [Enterococcus sp. 8G7_MSG3316]|uniref:Sortase n=1 Tax=Candidatus Enterococcus testudinis TaxID=1834191 RepID=A0A242A4I3_9ENTE|nr:class A sortase [Enterococcus sp. 8G7_MSG3316]OTN75947.1 hypothetical protein A5886_001023 [Enterococcus sp. 8G7_MSG3316]
MKQADRLIRCMIYLLTIFGIMMVYFPFLQESIVAIQLGNKKIILHQEFPVVAPEEPIRSVDVPAILENTTSEVDAYGFIEIPSISFQEPLLIGITNQNLLQGGVVMFPERQLSKDNVVLLGHNLGNQRVLFGQFVDLAVGSKVTVSYFDEKVTYQIIEKNFIEETNMVVTENNYGPRLTIITCPNARRSPHRWQIIALPVKEETLPDQEQNQSAGDNRITTQYEQWQKSQINGYIRILTVILQVLVGCFIINRSLGKKHSAVKNKQVI